MTLVTGETDENDPVYPLLPYLHPLNWMWWGTAGEVVPQWERFVQRRQGKQTSPVPSLKCRPFNIQTLQSIFVNHYSLRPRHEPQAVEASVTWSNKTKTEASSNESFHKRKVPTISERQLSLEVPGNSSHKLATQSHLISISPTIQSWVKKRQQVGGHCPDVHCSLDNVHHYSNLVLPPT